MIELTGLLIFFVIVLVLAAIFAGMAYMSTRENNYDDFKTQKEDVVVKTTKKAKKAAYKSNEAKLSTSTAVKRKTTPTVVAADTDTEHVEEEPFEAVPDFFTKQLNTRFSVNPMALVKKPETSIMPKVYSAPPQPRKQSVQLEKENKQPPIVAQTTQQTVMSTTNQTSPALETAQPIRAALNTKSMNDNTSNVKLMNNTRVPKSEQTNGFISNDNFVKQKVGNGQAKQQVNNNFTAMPQRGVQQQEKTTTMKTTETALQKPAPIARLDSTTSTSNSVHSAPMAPPHPALDQHMLITLQGKVQQLIDEKNKLDETYKATRDNLDNLSQTNLTLKNENAKLATKARELADKAFELETLKQTNLVLQTEMTKWINSFQALEKEKSKTEQKVKKETDKMKHNEQIAIDRLKKLEVEYETLKQAQKVHQNEDVQKSLEIKIKSLQDELAEAKRALQEKDGHENQIDGKLVEAQQKTATLQAELEESRKQLKEAEGYVQQMRQLSTQLTQAEEKSATLQAELAEARQTAQSSVQMQDESAKNVIDLLAAKDALQSQLDQITQENNKLTQTLAEKESQQNSQASEQQHDLEEQKSQLAIKIEEQTKDLAHKDTLIIELERRLQEFVEELETTQKQVKEKNEHIHEHNSHEADVKHQLNAARSEIDNLNKLIAEKEAELNNVKEATSNEFNSLREQLNEQKTKYEELESTIKHINTDKEQIQNEISAKDNTISEKEAEINSLKETLTQKEIESNKTMEHLEVIRNELSSLKVTLTEHSENLAATKEENQRLLNTNEELTKSLEEKLAEQAKTSSEEIATLKTQLENATNNAKNLEMSATSSTEQIVELKAKIEELTQLQTNVVATVQSENQEKLAQVSEENEKLKASLANLRSALASTEGTVMKLEASNLDQESRFANELKVQTAQLEKVQREKALADEISKQIISKLKVEVESHKKQLMADQNGKMNGNGNGHHHNGEENYPEIKAQLENIMAENAELKKQLDDKINASKKDFNGRAKMREVIKMGQEALDEEKLVAAKLHEHFEDNNKSEMSIQETN